MGSSAVSRALLGAALVIAAIGGLDAAIGRAWDLVVLFALIAVLAVVLLARTVGQRRTIELRDDLAVALTDRARLGGEPVGRAADRAVATYLRALDPTDAPQPPPDEAVDGPPDP